MVSIYEMIEADGKFVKITLTDGDIWEGKCSNYYQQEDDEDEPMLEMGNTLINQSEIAKIEFIN